VQFRADQGGKVPPNFIECRIAFPYPEARPSLFADGARVLGFVHLKEIVKGGMRERLNNAGDGNSFRDDYRNNPLTAAAIANEAGWIDFLAQATPKGQDGVHQERTGARPACGHDRHGTRCRPPSPRPMWGGHEHGNDGRQGSLETWWILDSNPTKLIEIVAIGKQLLIYPWLVNHVFQS